MWDGYVGQQIQRGTRNLLLVNGCLLLAVVVAAGLSWRYLYNFARGPFPMDRQTLLATTAERRLQKYYVTIQGDKTFETGIMLVERASASAPASTTDPVDAYYLALQVGHRLLLVKAPQATQSAQFSGALVPLPEAEKSQVVSRILAKNPELQGVFLPGMLDATSFRREGYWGLGIGIPLLLLSLWNLQKGFVRWSDPEGAPAVQILQKSGSPRNVAVQIESEIREQADTPDMDKVLVTRSWLLRPHFYGLDVVRLDDIAWVYKKVVRHYHSFIPVGRSYSVMVWDRSGKSLEISAREKDARAILEAIVRHAPWAISGYYKGLAQLWRKQRDQVLQNVDQRRATFLAQQQKQRRQKKERTLVPV